MGISHETRVKLTVIAAMSPLFIFLGIKLAPSGLVDVQAMHLSLTDWNVVEAGLVDRPGRSVLLIKMDNEPPGDDIAYERVVALDPTSGDLLGQIVDGYHFDLAGVTRDEVWTRAHRGDEHALFGYELPDLDPLYDYGDLFRQQPDLRHKVKYIRVDGPQADLRVYGLDGYEYRLTPRTGRVEKLPLRNGQVEKLPQDPPPITPTLLAGWGKCKFKYSGDLIDHRGCQPVAVDGRALSIRSAKQGPTSYWHITRPGEDGQPLWEISDQKLFGDLDADDPLRYIHFVTLQAGRLVLVADDGGDGDDVYAAAVDVKDGRVLWARVFW